MDLPGLICFLWGVALCILCIRFNFTNAEYYRPANEAWLEDFWHRPKGLVFLPLFFALGWPTATETFSFEAIPGYFWDRVLALVLGLFVGFFVARAMKAKANDKADKTI